MKDMSKLVHEAADLLACCASYPNPIASMSLPGSWSSDAKALALDAWIQVYTRDDITDVKCADMYAEAEATLREELAR